MSNRVCVLCGRDHNDWKAVRGTRGCPKNGGGAHRWSKPHKRTAKPEIRKRSAESRAKQSAARRLHKAMGVTKPHPMTGKSCGQPDPCDDPNLQKPVPSRPNTCPGLRMRANLLNDLNQVIGLAEVMCAGEVPPLSIAAWQQWVRDVGEEVRRHLGRIPRELP